MTSPEGMITQSASDQKVLDKPEPGAMHTKNVDNCGIKIMEVRTKPSGTSAPLNTKQSETSEKSQQKNYTEVRYPANKK